MSWGTIIFLVVMFLCIVNLTRKPKPAPSDGPKRIRETKSTCRVCGNVWYYGKEDVRQAEADKRHNASADMSDLGSAMMCCGGCAPAAFLPSAQRKQVKDLNKCPKCNSSAVVKEEVIHEI